MLWPTKGIGLLHVANDNKASFGPGLLTLMSPEPVFGLRPAARVLPLDSVVFGRALTKATSKLVRFRLRPNLHGLLANLAEARMPI